MLPRWQQQLKKRENMNTRLYGIKTLGSIVASAMVAMIPLMVQASDLKATSASTPSAESKEIADLKHQIYLCHHHKRHARACPIAQVIEKQVIVEKPVIVEKIVEKQVFVDRPAAAVVEKTEVVQTPLEMMDQRVIVKHSAHRTHLLHFGIPLISVSLF